MTKSAFLTLLAIGTVAAQGPDFKSLSGSAKSYQNQIKGLVQRSAEKMTEENYSFKPTPEVRSFGEIVAHVADAQYLFCATALGEKNPEPGIEKSKKTKAELTKAVQEAFAYCDKAYSALTDSNAGDVVKFFGGERSKLSLLTFNTMHSWEHYGNLVTYMRMKNTVPPSSERKN